MPWRKLLNKFIFFLLHLFHDKKIAFFIFTLLSFHNVRINGVIIPPRKLYHKCCSAWYLICLPCLLRWPWLYSRPHVLSFFSPLRRGGCLKRRVHMTEGWHVRMFAKRIKKRGAFGRGRERKKKKNSTVSSNTENVERKAWKNRKNIIVPNVLSRSNEAAVTAFLHRLFASSSFFSISFFSSPFRPHFSYYIAFTFNLNFLSFSGGLMIHNAKLLSWSIYLSWHFSLTCRI